MDIQVSHSALPATSRQTPDFPMVRLDTAMAVYQEALINGQYLVANMSATGRPKPREWVWNELGGSLVRMPSTGLFMAGVRPLRTRQHAFQLEVDGQLLVDRWAWIGDREVDAGRPGCRESVVVLRHSQRPVTVEVHTRLDDTPFLARWLVIANTGDRHVALAQVFPWSGQVFDVVPHHWLTTESRAPFTLGRFTDATPGTEGSFDWAPLPDGTYGFESLRGRSGWGAPFFILRNEITGEVVVGHFAWSGNWQVDLFSDREPARRPVCDARLYARIGLAGPAPLRVLEPGEAARTPEVHLGFLFGDLDGCVQALHAHERRSVTLPQPTGREHRVEANHTGYTANLQITETQLYDEIDVAADVGVELFTLDAGWFGEPSRLWYETVGDWDQESPLLPHGVKAAFDHARARGMLCGLWVEAEHMGPASRLLQRHPDWQMKRRGESIPNLDLSKPDVVQYLEDTIIGLVEKYNLDCFRLDYNIAIGEGGETERHSYPENVVWRYYDALYGVFERIHQRFPHLLLENCASGGGRTDLGMMSRFHWTQLSDNSTPGPALKIVNGMTLSLPPELCMTILGAWSPIAADLDFTLRIGLFGHFCVSGIFPTMHERQQVARERWRHSIELYKTFVRPMLPTCRMFHHTPIQRQTEAGDWVVLECVSEDAARGYAGIFRLGGAAADAYHLFPRGLDVSRRYRVTYDTTGRCREIPGDELVDRGLRVPVRGPFTSELLLFEPT